MIRTFGEYLYQFSNSVDIVDEDILGTIRKLILESIKKPLSVSFMEELEPGAVDESEGLHMISRFGDSGPLEYNKLMDRSGKYKGQTSFAFNVGNPMWIVSEDGGPLDETECYKDLWSETEEIPKFWKFHKSKVLTSIKLPMKHDHDIIGIINIECTRHIEYDQIVANELEIITKSLSILKQLCKNNKVRFDGTKNAMHFLSDLSMKTPFMQSRPSLFIASAINACDDVVGEIKEVADQFSQKLDIVFWKNIADSGDINKYIIQSIYRSKFGIVYLSAPIKESNTFEDNSNVLFEAGMLHALTNDPESNDPVAWIPIRENNGSKIPFDFSTERVLIVPRNTDRTLNTEKFRDELKKRIMALDISYPQKT